jgi:hypothetical protein
LQSPAAIVLTTVPSGSNEKPHMSFVQVLWMHKVSIPGHCAGVQPPPVPEVVEAPPPPLPLAELVDDGPCPPLPPPPVPTLDDALLVKTKSNPSTQAMSVVVAPSSMAM